MLLRGEPLLTVSVVALALLASGSGCASARHQQATGAVAGAEIQDVAVYPLAGTPDASPRSEISFRGIAPGDLASVKVVGSKSGLHKGRLSPHSDGQGVSFMPAKPFKAGETVRVSANVPLVGQNGGKVSFRIARPTGKLQPQQKFRDGSNPNVKGTNHYVSRPDLHPPRMRVTTSTPGASSGYLFVAPKSGPGQDGPLLLDPRGRVVWFHPLQRAYKAYDFRVARYDGKPVLTWWQGDAAGEYGGGIGVIADSAYHVIATVKGGNGYPVDLHEFRVTPQGTALIVANKAVAADTRKLGGVKNGAVLDSIAMEIDIKTGHVLFEWHSYGHLPLKQSYSVFKPSTAVDFSHLNSVALDDDGNFLLSPRNMWAVYKVDRRTGHILWTLGGKRSSFKLPKYARFVGQHDFTRAEDGTYTIFDNQNVVTPPKWISRALVFSIDPKAHSARLLHAYKQPQGKGAVTQGSVQLLPDGNYLVGWGGAGPDVSEFSHDGKLVFDGHLLVKVQSYRAYRFAWEGHPKRPPDVVVRRRKGHTVAYASWNGATGISSWQVLSGSNPDSLSVVAHGRARGFETPLTLPGPAAYVAVRALDDSGDVVARSKTLSLR